jgi:phosphoribosylamine--glycine ligase
VGLRILIVDQGGTSLAFALRCVKAGHAVRVFIMPYEKNSQEVGDGFKGIEKVDNWVASAKWADLIWCTFNDAFIPKLDSLRKAGIKVFGPCEKSAALEIKRSDGLNFLESAGVEVPSYKKFNSLYEAEAYVRKTEKRYVFKTLGDNDDKAMSYVSKTPADMIARLQRWQKLDMNTKGQVILQEFVPGVEFAVSRWMGVDGFLAPINENFEHKKLLSGDCGPNCGEAGTIAKYVSTSLLSESVMDPLEQALLKMGHLGAIDVNCIVDGDGKAWPLEFTSRPGWPIFNIMLALHKGDPAQWMLDACNGKDTLEVSPQVGCGVVVGIPDYPYSNKSRVEKTGIPIYGVTDKNRQYLAPQSVKMAKQPVMEAQKVVEKDMWTTVDDYLMVVTGVGKNVRQATQRAYTTLKDIHVPDMLYRDDIGEKLEDQLKTLHPLGYATEFQYG